MCAVRSTRLLKSVAFEKSKLRILLVAGLGIGYTGEYGVPSKNNLFTSLFHKGG